MTLRLRLVIGITLLVTVGLAIFGFTTYSLYRNSEYGRLDDQIRASAPLVETQLRENAGLQPTFGGGNGPGGSNEPSHGGDGDGGPHPPVVVPPGTYGRAARAAPGST